MVQSTGAANAQYLRGLVLGGEGVGEKKLGMEDNHKVEGERRWLASSRWAAAAQFALAVSLASSHNDLQSLEVEEENSIIRKTKDAVIMLRGVLGGKHDSEINESLNRYQISTDGWWSSLFRMIEGISKSSHIILYPLKYINSRITNVHLCCIQIQESHESIHLLFLLPTAV